MALKVAEAVLYAFRRLGSSRNTQYDGGEGRRFGRSVVVPVRAAPPPRRTYIDVSGDFADFGL